MYDQISILDKLLFIKVNTRSNTKLEGMEASKVAFIVIQARADNILN